MRSIAASTLELSSSTMITSNIEPMSSTRSATLTDTMQAIGIRTTASRISCRKALSCRKASSRPAAEWAHARTMRPRPVLPLKALSPPSASGDSGGFSKKPLPEETLDVASHLFAVKRRSTRVRAAVGIDGPHARAGEARAEAAALPRRAVDVEHRAVAAQRVLHDGEPQSGATRFARAAAVDAVEALGEARDMLGRDADPGVLDLEDRAVARGAPPEPHAPVLGRVADGVAHQVAEGARDLLLASQQVHAGLGADLDRVAPAAQGARLGAEAIEELVHVDALLKRRRRGRLERGEREEILDPALHAPRLVVPEVEVATRRVLVLLVAQGLEEAGDHGERRAQLVRDVGHELAAHALDLLELGHVAREHQALVLAVLHPLQ